MSNLLQVTPFLHVADMERALAFFAGTLGFRITYREANYCYITREAVAFRLLESAEDEPPPAGLRRFAYYIDVRDVDALYAELKPKLDRLPPGDVAGPIDQEYGQRELMVVAPDGELLVFGQAIAAGAGSYSTP